MSMTRVSAVGGQAASPYQTSKFCRKCTSSPSTMTHMLLSCTQLTKCVCMWKYTHKYMHMQCACMYLSVDRHPCMYVHTCANTYTDTYACTCTCTHICIYIQTWLHTHRYIHIYTHSYTYQKKPIHVYICIYIYIHIYIIVYIYEAMHVRNT